MENSMEPSQVCPRCGADLVRGFTSAHKVCWDCPSCGGRLVTLPVLKAGLGARVTTLLEAVQDIASDGCRCPTCGDAMGLVTVAGEDGRKIEIDVCGKCLSVWCDRGEFEAVVAQRVSGLTPLSMKELASQTPPEVRERLARTMLADMPESSEPWDMSLGEVVQNVLRLVVGAPTLWKNVRPSSPILSILFLVAIPLGQCLTYLTWGRSATRIFYGSYRSFWILNDAMVEGGGFGGFSSWTSFLTYPFLQCDGVGSLLLAFILYPVVTVIERKAGIVKFLALIGSFWILSLLAHSLQVLWTQPKSGAMCGIGPIAVGCVSYLLMAYPDLRLKWMKMSDFAGIHWIIAGLVVLSDQIMISITAQGSSLSLCALFSCLVLGAWWGRRTNLRQRLAECPRK